MGLHGGKVTRWNNNANIPKKMDKSYVFSNRSSVDAEISFSLNVQVCAWGSMEWNHKNTVIECCRHEFDFENTRFVKLINVTL